MAAPATAAGVEDLDKRVADLEESLAAALARLETVTGRERRWRRENQELRAQLRESGQRWVEGQKDEEGEPLEALSPIERAARLNSSSRLSCESAHPTCAESGGDVDQHQVEIIGTDGKVPALLLASSDCLEFVELKARITPSEFVGIKSSTKQTFGKPMSKKGSVGSKDKSWLWRMVAPVPKTGGTSSPQDRSPSSSLPSGGYLQKIADQEDQQQQQQAGRPAKAKPPRPPQGPADEPKSSPARKLGNIARLSWSGVMSAASAEWQHPPPSSERNASDRPEGKGSMEPILSGPLDDIPHAAMEALGTDSFSGGDLDLDQAGQWDILWKAGGGSGPLRKLAFSASTETRTFIHQQVETWADQQSGCSSFHLGSENEDTSDLRAVNMDPRPTLIRTPPPAGGIVEEAPAEEESEQDEPGTSGEVVEPSHLREGKWLPHLTGESDVLSEHHIKCLCFQLPRRMHQAPWELLYSTEKHGISLHTLYRKATGWTNTLLVVTDGAGYVFGSFNTEAWKMAPRYFGTGESFVFQLTPHMVAYPWKRKSKERNDFYQYATMDSIAVGGGGHFALWMDQDLAFGNSGVSDTFGSPCLAGSEEFRVKGVELWGIRG